MPDYCLRIHHPYEDAKRIFAAFALRCDKLVVYEHPADGKTKRIHCHALLTGTNVDKKQLRNVAEGTHSVDVKGNGNMAFSEDEWDQDMHFVTYMSKGKWDPKYYKGFSEEDITTAKSLWVERKSASFVDKADKEYLAFAQGMFDCKAVWRDGTGAECLHPQYFPLITAARAYVHQVFGGFHKPKNFNILKNFLREYAYTMNVSIPKGEKGFW